jgi:hypothetical protein
VLKWKSKKGGLDRKSSAKREDIQGGAGEGDDIRLIVRQAGASPEGQALLQLLAAATATATPTQRNRP